MFTRKPGAEPPAWAGELVLRFVGARGSYPVLDREGAQIASLPAAELLDLLPRSDPHGGAGEEVPAEADRLFATVFHGEVLTRLESARTAASTTQARVRLTIDLAGAAELEDVAWELLGVSGLAPAMEVVRSVGTLARGDRDLVRPIDILAVLPNGSDNHLEAERGWHHLHTAVKAFCNDGAASLTRLPSARMSDIEKALAGQAFQVLHFIGSGRSEPGSQNGTVVLESETGGPRKVTAEYFSSRLDAYPPLQLVVLEPNDSHCGVNPFAMTARTLVSGRRSAVVALRRPLTGSPTGAWAGPLYASLAGGNSIDRGVTAARRALARGGAGQDWASPMLYAIPGALGEPQPAADEPAQDGPAVVAAGGTGTPPEDELAALRDVRKVTCTRPPAPPESEEPAPPAEQPVRPLRPPITGRLPLWGQPVPDVHTILLLSADPSDTTRLRLAAEQREIDIQLRLAMYRDRYRLEHRPAARPDDLQQAILGLRPRIVHFCGHGAGKDGLCFEDDRGRTQLVPTQALADLFKLVADAVDCVVLNSCHSEVQAKAIGGHIHHVVGMRSAVGDLTAIKFATFFYFALASGYPI